LKPKPSAVLCIALAPTATASGAKLVLQEFSMAWRNGILPEPQFGISLWTTLVDWGSR
jgi:hypothetical protein